MANEAKITTLSPVTVSSSTATVAVGDVSGTASVVAALSSTNHSNYPLGIAELSFTGTNSISSASATINLYRRDINVNGTADNPVLSTATNALWLNNYVGSFVAAATSASFSTAQDLTINDIPLSPECEFYIENKLNIPVGANWVLKVTPKTFVPGT
jgi:hypothetical protein